MIVWLLIGSLGQGPIVVPDIATETDCKQLAEQIRGKLPEAVGKWTDQFCLPYRKADSH